VSIAILIDHLVHDFGEHRVIDGISLRVRQGEVFGFLGHNGAGKTTTVRLVNGLLTPTSGKVRVLGLHPATQGEKLRRRTGVLTEHPAVDERLTVREQLRFFGALFGVEAKILPKRIAELCERFGLNDRLDERVKTFSKGMRQRLALIRTLLHEPELLFLDEPTSGLDPAAIREVHDLIETLVKEGRHTIFLCTHNLHEAQRLCHRVAILQEGRVLAEGEPRKLATELVAGVTLKLELHRSDLERLATLVEQSEGVSLQRIEGDEAWIQVARREDVPAFLHALIRQGVPLFGASPQVPDLEAVYFSEHEREAKRGKG
jgi:ABC-2 type transport system ATP-binding protein